MEHKHRECRVCESVELEPVLVLPNYPLATGPVTRVPKTVPTCDLDVWLCRHCGTCVLLNADVDRLPYDDDYTSSSVAYGRTKSVDEQTDRFIEFIRRTGKAPGDKVLEVGCYDGALMGLLEARCEFNMLGCEPCTPVASDAKEKGYNIHLGAFDANDYSELDMVIARNVLEHIVSPNQFVRDVALTLKQDGAFVPEVPAGEHYIHDGILGTIVPQHPCYFGKSSLERLLGMHFTTVITEEDKATIRARASYPRSGDDDINWSAATTAVEWLVDAGWLMVGGQARQARYEAVQEAVGSETVDVFGANTCALELVAAEAIKAEQIGKVYDDDPHRWGRYLVNTDRAVLPRGTIGEGKRRKILVCSYTHRRSIADYITKQNSIAVMLYGEDE